MSSDILPGTETGAPSAGPVSANSPKQVLARSGNLYVELPGDRWERGRRQLRNSCDVLVRRYPSLADAARSEGKSVEQFLMDVMFADLLPARLALAKLTFPSPAMPALTGHYRRAYRSSLRRNGNCPVRIGKQSVPMGTGIRHSPYSVSTTDLRVRRVTSKSRST